jgi:hypothetical protein
VLSFGIFCLRLVRQRIEYDVPGILKFLDASIHKEGDMMNFRYGQSGTTTVQSAPDGSLFVQLDLRGWQFVVLE